MKIQCDVCGKEEASVFCCADEAALCGACDRRVHQANKLAGKHQRFSLISPSSSASLHPTCDVCQEKKAFVFCQEDRAILCTDCDGPIHTANDFTRKHNRFVLTGVKLSPTAAAAAAADLPESAAPSVTGLTSSSTSSASLKEDLDTCRATKRKKPVPAVEPDRPPPPPLAPNTGNICNSDSDASVVGKAKLVALEAQAGGLVGDMASSGGDGSSISDYLMKTLPGWRVEDLLLDYPSQSLSYYSPLPSRSLYKMGDMGEGFVPFAEADLDAGEFGGRDAPAWCVPQVPQAPPQSATTISFSHGGLIGDGQERWMNDDGGFTVPQIMSQQPQCNRRPGRSVWYA